MGRNTQENEEMNLFLGGCDCPEGPYLSALGKRRVILSGLRNIFIGVTYGS
jgi:hypothetical protein